MRELLESLREDIGIPKEDENEIGTAYYQTVNKAILLDKERNKENLNSDEIGTEYLTLRKFGVSSQTTRPASVNSLHKGLKKEDQDLLNQSNQANNYNKQLFNEYENQIIRNIQSIRRNSNDNGSEKAVSRKNSVEKNQRANSNESVRSSKTGSILKKSPSLSSEVSRKNSNESDKSPIVPKQEDHDDDDDIDFGNKTLPNQKPTNSRALNETRSINKSEYEEEEEALFNDDYGEPEEDDDFDKMLQTKSYQERKSSSENDRSFGTPTPRPRRSMGMSNEKKNQSDSEDDDDF